MEQFRQSLLVLPALIIVGLIGLAAALLWVDSVTDDIAPSVLRVSVPSARVILGTIATGLVAGVALVFSSILVSLQLAASMFSPRTLRGFLGDRRQQITIGLVVGTAIYCLVVLLGTRSPMDSTGGYTIEPHLSVVVAVLLALISLLAIVAAVNHLAQSLQVERQLADIQHETLTIIRRQPRREAQPLPSPTRESDQPAVVVMAPASGWVQQISIAALRTSAPQQGGIAVLTNVGGYVWEDEPIARIWPTGSVDDETRAHVTGALAIGTQRTMQEDIGFGLLRLTDVALRALSPGINDPNTAIDVIGRSGAVLVELAVRADTPRIHDGGDSIVLIPTAPTFADHLTSVCTPLRTAAAPHCLVASALAAMLARLSDEVHRRAVPADMRCIQTELDALLDEVRAGPLSARDRAVVFTAARREQGDVA